MDSLDTLHKRPVSDTHYLADYQPPTFLVSKTQLRIELGEVSTKVICHLHVSKNPASRRYKKDLVLRGEGMELLCIQVDGKVLEPHRYSIDSKKLTIYGLPKQCIVTTKVRIKPQDNMSLEGLYKSRNLYCTQCEAEGFRKITYHPDRPDVMSVFTTTIVADKDKYPVLLSNGNPEMRGEYEANLHWITWHDPHPKPAHLFALVAGDLSRLDDRFTTCSGRIVNLQLYAEAKDIDKCHFALDTLKTAMRWDEDVFGREYDLDIFMIAAVDDFNMGAMENKGLNIFNTSALLATPTTTTDTSYKTVETIVAHEYFHNWSGNRVGCRDWFQLSLKEGFTVFRDSLFSSDVGSATLKRIQDVNKLRTAQFAEDSSPMAHSVQPDSYIEISNFYTRTVYDKGAEIVRMLRTLLGPAKFRQGSDLYFSRFDGQAVTIEDFVAAMAEVSGRNLDQFFLWYKQAGTPRLSVTGKYDEHARTYTLQVSQRSLSTPDDTEKQPFHIPLIVGLVTDNGDLPIISSNGADTIVHTQCNGITRQTTGHSVLLEVTQTHQEFVLENVTAPLSAVLNKRAPERA